MTTGDVVTAGQVLVTLDQYDAQVALRKAEAALAQAEATLESTEDAQDSATSETSSTVSTSTGTSVGSSAGTGTSSTSVTRGVRRRWHRIGRLRRGRDRLDGRFHNHWRLSRIGAQSRLFDHRGAQRADGWGGGRREAGAVPERIITEFDPLAGTLSAQWDYEGVLSGPGDTSGLARDRWIVSMGGAPIIGR